MMNDNYSRIRVSTEHPGDWVYVSNEEATALLLSGGFYVITFVDDNGLAHRIDGPARIYTTSGVCGPTDFSVGGKKAVYEYYTHGVMRSVHYGSHPAVRVN